MKLIPVLAIDPQYFADVGIVGVDLYRSGCWLVEVSKFTPEMASILLSKESGIDDCKLSQFDRVMGLDGGYILAVSKTVEILPRCCSDLGNIEEWDRAANWLDSAEMMLWIGHPWLLVSSIDSQHILIRDGEDQCVDPIEMVIDRNELKAAVMDARQQLDIFRQILEFEI
jgi:hypothetical protein